MGQIRLADESQLEATLNGKEDRAALRAALRATPDTDTGTAGDQESTIHIPLDNQSNLVALWATGFAWENSALAAAMDQLVPIAWGQVALHSGAFRLGRRDKEVLAQIRQARQG